MEKEIKRVLLASVAAVAAAMPAFAQDSAAPARPAVETPRDEPAAGQDTGEIVVTATRQEQALGRVPLSVAAYSQETLDRQGVRRVDDIGRLTPGLNFARGAGSNSAQSNISVRGVRSTSGIPTTGVYIDDTPVQIRVGSSQTLANPYPQIFDLDRVEVLRGPQGTLFGSGSLGGAIRFITPSPSLSRSSVYGRAEIATTHKGGLSYEAGVAIGAPIIEDKLGLRASAWYRRDGGYVDRFDPLTGARTREDMNRTDNYTARIALGWQPVEALTITPSLYFQEVNSQDGPSYSIARSDIDSSDFRNNNAFIAQPNRDRFFLPALKLELDVGAAILISNTSYLSRRVEGNTDDSVLSLVTFGQYSGPFPQSLATYRARGDYFNRQNVLTQEVRIQNSDPDAAFNWVAGLFYSRSKVRDRNLSSDPDVLRVINFNNPAPFPSVQSVFGVPLYQGRYSLFLDTRFEDEQKAAFAQFDLKVTDKLKLTAGLRYTEATFDSTSFAAGPIIASTGRVRELSSRNKPFTPKFGVAYQADRNNLFYANVAKGFRIGGATAAVGGRCAADAAAIGFDPLVARPIEPDSVWSYEIGSKNKLFGNRVSIDAAAYRIDWKNVQTLLTLPTCQVPTTLNLGDARSEGFDLAISARPRDRLTLGVAVGYTNSRYTSDFPGPNGVTLRRRGEPLDVPPWTLYFYGQQDFDLGSAIGYFRGDLTYASKNEKPLDVASPLVDPSIPRTAARTSLDLRTGIRFDEIDVSLFASNLLNAHPELARYSDGFGSGNFRAITLRPRTIGLTATVRR